MEERSEGREGSEETKDLGKEVREGREGKEGREESRKYRTPAEFDPFAFSSEQRPRVFKGPALRKKERSGFGMGSIFEIADRYSAAPYGTLAIRRPYEVPIKRLLDYMVQCIQDNRPDDFILLFRQFPYYKFNYLLQEAAMTPGPPGTSEPPPILSFLLDQLRRIAEPGKISKGRLVRYIESNAEIVRGYSDYLTPIKWNISRDGSWAYKDPVSVSRETLYLIDSRVIFLIQIGSDKSVVPVIEGNSIGKNILTLIFHPESLPKAEVLLQSEPLPSEFIPELKARLEAKDREYYISVLNNLRICFGALFKTLLKYDETKNAGEPTGKPVVYYMDKFRDQLRKDLGMAADVDFSPDIQGYFPGITEFLTKETLSVDGRISKRSYNFALVNMLNQLPASDVIELTDDISTDILDSRDVNGLYLLNLFSSCRNPIKIFVKFRERGIDLSHIDAISLNRILSDLDIEFDDFEKFAGLGGLPGGANIAKWCEVSRRADRREPNPEIINFLIKNNICSLDQFVDSVEESVQYVLVKGFDKYIPNQAHIEVCIWSNFISVLYLVYQKLKTGHTNDITFEEYKILLKNNGYHFEAFEDVVEPPFVGEGKRY